MTEHAVSVVYTSEAIGEVPGAEGLIAECVAGALRQENVEVPCDVCVMLTDDDGITALNAEHRGLDKPTDVLSFPMLELEPGGSIEVSPLELDPKTGHVMLGDIAISLTRAEEQAKEYGHSRERELAFLAVHATLHLLGYDHEYDEEMERLHFSRQEEILTALGKER